MGQESFLLTKIGDLPISPLVACGEGESIFVAAAAMARANSSSLVVFRDGQPAGIITDSDLRRTMGRMAGEKKDFTAGDVMNSPVHTLSSSKHVFDAIELMTRKRIHHIVVTDDDCRAVSVLSDENLIGAQADSPFIFGRMVDNARTVEELKAAAARMNDIAARVYGLGEGVESMSGMVASFYDSLTRRVLELTAGNLVPDLIGRFSLMVTGSEGRKEQTLKTDQDNVLVYSDDLTGEEEARLWGFSHHLVETLAGIGLPRCPGDMMAHNPLCRKSISSWVQSVERWILNACPENVTNFGMFCDFRTIWGPPEFEREIKRAIHRTLERNPIFLSYMARNILRFPPPIGLFKRIKTEEKGEHKGRVDLKKAGVFTLSEGMTLLGLEAGFLEGPTLEKISKLAAAGVIDQESAGRYRDAYAFLFTIRLKHQITMYKKGLPPDNMIDPNELSLAEMAGFVETLKVIKYFQSHLREKFKVDMISV